MTRDEVLELIRAHLADELQIDPARITEVTHFKQDLDADSLDLYTLVLEFEDTYGVKMSDEQAARVQTVGQAVDFVLAHLPASAIEGPDGPRSSQNAGLDGPRTKPV
jgi:acyl carrier protein